MYNIIGYLPPPIRPTQLAQRLLQQQKYERVADEGQSVIVCVCVCVCVCVFPTPLIYHVSHPCHIIHRFLRLTSSLTSMCDVCFLTLAGEVEEIEMEVDDTTDNVDDNEEVTNKCSDQTFFPCTSFS